MSDTQHVSRDPSDYHPDPNGHFRRRLDEREIPPTAVKMAIESGEMEQQEENRIKFTTTYLGYEFVVVVNPKKGYAITTYSNDDW